MNSSREWVRSSRHLAAGKRGVGVRGLPHLDRLDLRDDDKRNRASRARLRCSAVGIAPARSSRKFRARVPCPFVEEVPRPGPARDELLGGARGQLEAVDQRRHDRSRSK
jgi:hypothetical protein